MTEAALPTIGRVVHFVPNMNDRHWFAGADAGPLAAIICHVHGPTMVNVVVFDAYGTTQGRTSVYFGEENAPGEGATKSSYCFWPPRV